MKPGGWIASTRDDIFCATSPCGGLPRVPAASVQRGEAPLDMKALAQFGPGVFELMESQDRNAYRLVYEANLRKAM
jgi:phage-related protein